MPNNLTKNFKHGPPVSYHKTKQTTCAYPGIAAPFHRQYNKSSQKLYAQWIPFKISNQPSGTLYKDILKYKTDPRVRI